MRWFIFLSLAIWAIILFFIFKKPKEVAKNETKTDTVRVSDTVVIFDTIKITEFQPTKEYITRYDTIIVSDTIATYIPIQVKEFQTKDYRAVIEGYKPALLSLDIYNKNTTIIDTIKIHTNTVITKIKHPRIALSVGGGVDFKGNPYVGVGVGYVIWSK